MNNVSAFLFGNTVAALPPIEPIPAPTEGQPPARLIFTQHTTTTVRKTTLSFERKPGVTPPKPPGGGAAQKAKVKTALLSTPEVVMVHLKSGQFEREMDGQRRTWMLILPPDDMPSECNGIARFYQSAPETAEVHIYGPGPATGRLRYVGMALLKQEAAEAAEKDPGEMTQEELAAYIDANALPYQWRCNCTPCKSGRLAGPNPREADWERGRVKASDTVRFRDRNAEIRLIPGDMKAAAMRQAGGELTQKKLAELIDTWGLDFEVACNCEVCSGTFWNRPMPGKSVRDYFGKYLLKLKA